MTTRSTATAYALLLRGVNVAGRSTLPMATLRDVLTRLGYDGVRTYLQSGNAVVATRQSPEGVVAETQRALQEQVGRSIDVVVRTAPQLARIVDGWPFDATVAATTKHVTFLRAGSDAAPLADLSRGEFAPEQFAVHGAEVYLSVPHGLGRSRLATVLARRLAGTVATTRNWNTVTALRDLTAALGG